MYAQGTQNLDIKTKVSNSELLDSGSLDCGILCMYFNFMWQANSKSGISNYFHFEILLFDSMFFI